MKKNIAPGQVWTIESDDDDPTPYVYYIVSTVGMITLLVLEHSVRPIGTTRAVSLGFLNGDCCRRIA